MVKIEDPSALSVPCRSWSSISMDFITNLPPSKAFDNIFVVVDRLQSMRSLSPVRRRLQVKTQQDFFLNNVYRYHGLPDDIMSDGGIQFVSKFGDFSLKY